MRFAFYGMFINVSLNAMRLTTLRDMIRRRTLLASNARADTNMSLNVQLSDVTKMVDMHKHNKMDACEEDFEFGIECLSVDCANCRYGLCLSRKIYCSVLKENVDVIVPEYCPYFEPELLEFKLFRRARTSTPRARAALTG